MNQKNHSLIFRVECCGQEETIEYCDKNRIQLDKNYIYGRRRFDDDDGDNDYDNEMNK